MFSSKADNIIGQGRKYSQVGNTIVPGDMLFMSPSPPHYASALDVGGGELPPLCGGGELTPFLLEFL